MRVEIEQPTIFFIAGQLGLCLVNLWHYWFNYKDIARTYTKLFQGVFYLGYHADCK